MDFEWLLSGDDDTVFLIDKVINLVRDLDPDDQYYFTDNLPSNGESCTLREEASERGPNGCIKSPPATPCTRAVLEHPSVCGSENVHKVPGRMDEPTGTVRGFGQVGFLTSRGLVNSISEADMMACEHCNTSDFCHPKSKVCSGKQCSGGGDVRARAAFWGG
jgi:hypothetical protein